MSKDRMDNGYVVIEKPWGAYTDIYRTPTTVFKQIILSKNAKENLEKAIDVLANDGAEAIILGCTEIPLAIKRTQHDSLPLINTTKILATALLLETKPDAINIE